MNADSLINIYIVVSDHTVGFDPMDTIYFTSPKPKEQILQKCHACMYEWQTEVNNSIVNIPTWQDYILTYEIELT